MVELETPAVAWQLSEWWQVTAKSCGPARRDRALTGLGFRVYGLGFRILELGTLGVNVSEPKQRPHRYSLCSPYAAT